MATKFVRVQDKRTGHEYTTAHVDTENHTVLDKPAVGRNGKPLKAKFKPRSLKKLETEDSNTDDKAAATTAATTKGGSK